MREKTLSFDWKVAKKLLRSSWLLWLAYLAVLLLVLPIDMMNKSSCGTLDLAEAILRDGFTIIRRSRSFGLLAAMCVFRFFYSRGSMGGDLPTRREGLFFTVWLTGLAPLLLLDFLVMLLTVCLFKPSGIVMGYYLQWLLLTVMGNLMFYGFASFCAMLTDSLVILPIVYAVLLLTASVVEDSLRSVFGTFVYGRVGRPWPLLEWLAPLDRFYDLKVRTDPVPFVDGWNLLAVYAGAALLFSCAASLLLRCRRVEKAGDAVAIPALKPVFKYCMTGGCALILADLACGVQAYLHPRVGMDQAMLVLSRMLIGGFVGYFAAEMLMQRSWRVFRSQWKGYLLSCCVMTGLVLGMELDLFGYERYVPELDRVASVVVSGDGGDSVTRPESIEQVIALHRQIIENKQRNENAEDRRTVRIAYTLQSGRIVVRSFPVDNSEEAWSDPDSDIRCYRDALNMQELLENRCSAALALTAETLDRLEIRVSKQVVTLRGEQALAFCRDCLLPDIADGQVNRVWGYHWEDYYATESNARITIYLTEHIVDELGQSKEYSYKKLFALTVNAVNCLEWIRENTDLEPMSWGQAAGES